MAPPKTDKDKEKDAQHLKKMLKMARKRPINFGISLGKGDESLAFLSHQARDPKSLRKKAREETGNSKGAHGEMTVDGKNLVFACQDSPPGPIVKAMRLFLKDLKVPLRAEFLGPDEAPGSARAASADGAEDADGADGAEAAPAEADSADGAGADGPQAKWEAVFARLEPAVGRALTERLVADVSKLRVRWTYAVEQANDGAYEKALATVPNIVKILREGLKPAEADGADGAGDADGAPDPRLPKMRAAMALIAKRAVALPQGEARKSLGIGLREVRAQIDAGEAEAAMSGLASMQATLKAAETAPADGAPTEAAPADGAEDAGVQAKWEAAFARLEPEVNRALTERLVADVGKLRARWSYAVGQANDGVYEKALATIPNIEKMLREGAAASAGDAEGVEEDVASSNPTEFWADARDAVSVSLESFRSKLSAEDDPNLKRIAEHGLSGITDGNNVALMAALFGYNTSSSTDRPKNAKIVQQRIDEYRKFLASSSLITLCENNPFGQIDIRGPLKIALDKLEAAVTA